MNSSTEPARRKMQKGLWSLIAGFGLCLSASAQHQGPLPALEALPTAEAMGPGWSRELMFLLDGARASKPVELYAASSRLPESFKTQLRDAVQNPTNRISGLSNTRFTFQSKDTHRFYEVQMERYRSQDQLRADFDNLLAFDSSEYKKHLVGILGDAAVHYTKTNGGSTLWFRRAEFKVWISLGPGTNWAQDEHLQRLTKALDHRILEATDGIVKPSRTGDEQDTPSRPADAINETVEPQSRAPSKVSGEGEERKSSRNPSPPR